MNRIFFNIATALLLVAFTSSCSEEPATTYNPFDENKKGEFLPSNITINKSTDNFTLCETWSDITRNSENRITGYKYRYEYNTITGDITNEERVCRINYFKDHTGKDIITTETDIEYYQNQKGIQDQYTQRLDESISLNGNGLIDRIATTIKNFENDTTIMTTSERTFSYHDDFCTSSTYNDNTSRITYTYSWNAYQLVDISILKDNTDGIIEYEKYQYTYDKELYLYSGTELLPFVQRGFPEILASMGYFGKSTPYVLADEKFSRRIIHNNITTSTEIDNKYSFSDNINFEMRYAALSNIYSDFDIVFRK